jgi:hypothetical protein
MRFPLQGLDMAPFTTSEVLRGRAGGSRCSSTAAADNGDAAAGKGDAAAVEEGSGKEADKQPDTQHTTAAAAGSDDPVSFQQQCLYELFGVVSHHGDMASGHYVSYVKCEGHWYLVNDPWVVAVSEADVAQVQAYMLFYAQEYLFGSGSSSKSSSVLGKQLAAAAAAAAVAAVDKEKQQQGTAGAAVVLKVEPTAADVAAVKLEPVCAALEVKKEPAPLAATPAAAAAAAAAAGNPVVKAEPTQPISRPTAAAPASLILGEQRPVSPELGLTSPSILKPSPAAAATGLPGLGIGLGGGLTLGSPQLGGGGLLAAMSLDGLVSAAAGVGGCDDDGEMLVPGLLEEQASAAGLDMAML